VKDFNLLIWLTQLGFSVAFPLAGFILLGIWLHRSCGMGVWTVWAGIGIGLSSAISGFRNALRSMERMTKDRKKDDPPPLSFNDHH
jgi:hypothetical protein